MTERSKYLLRHTRDTAILGMFYGAFLAVEVGVFVCVGATLIGSVFTMFSENILQYLIVGGMIIGPGAVFVALSWYLANKVRVNPSGIPEDLEEMLEIFMVIVGGIVFIAILLLCTIFCLEYVFT